MGWCELRHSSEANMTPHPTTKRRSWPLILSAAGLFLLFAGFVYEVMFAGIPYQDPTPEMSARYARHVGIASTIRWCGAGVFFLGSSVGIVRRFARKTESPVVA